VRRRMGAGQGMEEAGHQGHDVEEGGTGWSRKEEADLHG
jgi:hypothetical protein